ncbi:MAG: hypothetical protein HQK51_03800 [Oligoflexia bacterium]|nr:hypothetical protein [Oligoflexia bacterium]
MNKIFINALLIFSLLILFFALVGCGASGPAIEDPFNANLPLLPPTTPEEDFVRFQNNCVKNVEKQVNNLSNGGEKLCLEAQNGFSGLEYTIELFNYNPIGIENHFQGIVRKGGYIYLSGSDQNSGQARIWVGQVSGYKEENQVLSSNIKSENSSINYYNYNTDDKIIKGINVTIEPSWHVGGLSLLGDLLAVPVEEYRESEGYDLYSSVLFFDVRDSANPRLIKKANILSRPGRDAGSSFLHRLADGRFIVGLGTTHINNNYLDIYVSKTTNIQDGFQEQPLPIPQVELSNIVRSQGMGMVVDCDTKENYLIVTDTEGGGTITRDGIYSATNLLRLYKLTFHKENPDIDNSPIVRVHSEDRGQKMLEVININAYSHFAAAAGIVTNKNNELLILASNHYRFYNLRAPTKRIIKVKEYRGSL